MPERQRILVVDDEPNILAFLDGNLADDGYDVMTATCGAQAISRASGSQPSLILLDVGLPDQSGYDVCRVIREGETGFARINPDTPIIMLTARGDDVDRVRGLQRGADDYVTKPYHYPELLLRIEALLRRTGDPRSNDAFEVAGISIDAAQRTVAVNDHPVQLSVKEFDLLIALAREPGRVHTRDDLLRDVWEFQAHGSTRTLDSHASRLRKKLMPFANGRRYVVNVFAVGYRLVDVHDEAATSME